MALRYVAGRDGEPHFQTYTPWRGIHTKAVGSRRGTRLSWGRSWGQPTLTMAMPVFWWCPTPPSTARTMRMYSDLASRSSRDVVVISPAARGDERDGGCCMVTSYPGFGEQQHW